MKDVTGTCGAGALIMGLVWAMGCSPAPTQVPPPSAPAAAPLVTQAPPPPTPSVAPQVQPPPASSAVATPPKPSPFSIAATGDSLRMYRLDNHVFVGHVAGLAEVKGDSLVDAMPVMGPLRLGAGQTLFRLLGSWPDSAYAVVETFNNCHEGSTSWDLRRWNKDRWIAAREANRLRPTTAAAARGGIVGSTSGDRIEQVGVGALGFDMDGKPITEPATWIPGNEYRGDGIQIVGTGDGGLHVLGNLALGKPNAEKDVGRMLASSDGRKGRLTVMPLPCETAEKRWRVGMATLARGGDGHLVVYGARSEKAGGDVAAIGRYVDGTWTCESVPGYEAITDVSVSRRGVVGAIAAKGRAKAVIRRGSDGLFEVLPLPERASPDGTKSWPLTPLSLAFGDDEALWVLAEGSSRSDNVVLRDRPVGKEYVFPELDAAQLELAEYDPPKAATPSCETPFAMLYTLAKTAPANYDFPLTREALKGHTEFEGARFLLARNLGERYFGAIPKNYDQGKRLIEVVKQGVAGSSPVYICRKPLHILRDIPFDLKTGKLLPPPPTAEAPKFE